ncbi:MAG: hypothetical protein ABI539_06545 [Acidobacteriota bacterium]
MLANYYILLVFAPVLIVVGILGFLIPPNKALTSGEPAYNMFHIVFGISGLLIVLTVSDTAIRGFNLIFGAIDLYQACASYFGWFPKTLFKWTRVDDLLHVLIGLILVGAALLA